MSALLLMLSHFDSQLQRTNVRGAGPVGPLAPAAASAYVRMTMIFGKLFLIYFAVGCRSRDRFDFPFGMSWSGYSRFFSDAFSAPLVMAMAGLLALCMGIHIPRPVDLRLE